MRKKLLVLLLSAILLLSACLGKAGPSPAAETPAAARTTSTARKTIIQFALYDQEQERYQALVHSFNESHPDIEVRLVSIDEILASGTQQRGWSEDAWVRLASSADVIKVSVGTPRPGPGMVRDLTPLVEEEAGLEDFYPGTLTGCQDRHGLWCLPVAANASLFFYDKEAFDRAAVPYPEPGWTWDDLLSKALALTDEAADEGNPEASSWGLVLHAFEYQLLVEGQVGSLVDRITDPPTVRLDRPETIGAVRWATDLALAHKVTPNLFSIEDAMESATLVEEGKAAMWAQAYSDWSWLSQRKSVGIVPFPVSSAVRSGANESTPVWGADNVFISAGTAHPEAAWRWIEVLGEGAMEIYEGHLLPARRSVAEEAGGFWDQAAPELAAALRYAVEHGYGAQWSLADLRDTGSASSAGAFYEAIGAILSGEKSVEDALAEAQTQAQAALRAEVERQAQATPGPTIVVAPPRDAEGTASDATTIVFAPPSGTTAYNPAALRTLVERFQETHPDLVVEVRDPRLQVGGFMRNLAQASDCFGCLPMFQEPGSREAILSLQPFLDADPSFSIDDFYPALLAPFIQQGQLLGLPGEARPEIIRYDKGLFDAAGVAYPKADWTTDDFLATAIALTQRRVLSKRYGFLGALSEVHSLTLMMERWGANLLDRSVDPPTAALNAPSTVGALRWYADLSVLHGVKPPYLASDRERSRLIGRGQAAMWLVTESWELLRDADEADTGLASVPAGAGSTAGAYRYVDGYYISAHTQFGQACWEWITFLTAQPEAAWGVPARRSVVESEAYRQWVGEERAAVHEASVSGAERAPMSANYGAEGWLHVITLLLERAYEQVIESDATVEEALDAAQHTFDAYRACVVTREVTSDEEGWRACARETDPDLADLLPGE